MWCKRVTASFATAGYEVVTARDASEALDLSEKAEPAVVILDANLNGEDGIMLLKFLKRNHPKLPVIVFSGVGHDDDSIRKMHELGADLYLPKTSVEELIVAVGPYM